MTKKRLAIIGNGMATSRLLDELQRRDAGATYDIAVFGEEPRGAYNRILLGRIIAGDEADDITLKSRDWYARHGIAFHSGRLVTNLDTLKRTLTTDDGATHAYDVAVFATGSAPFVPRMEGIAKPQAALKPGLFQFRTVEDCQRIRAAALPGASAVVIGGGLLGLEAAKALCDLGVHVTVLHLADTLMNLQVDRHGGAILRAAIEKMGIFVRTGVSAVGITGDDRATGVTLATGETIPADLVVLACGIVPRVETAKAANIPVKKGILVNDLLATQVPGVYAVGECAEHNGTVYGIVPPIWEQCGVLADLLTAANPKARYRGSKLYTRLKVVGVDVASMGLVEPQFDSDEVIQIIEDRKGIYRKLIVRDGRLLGAVLIGDTEASAALVQLYDRNDILPANRLDLLASPGGGLAAAADPEVCNCHHVSESAIVDAIKDGCTTLPMLADCTKAGTGCGSCRGQLANLILKNAAPAGSATVALSVG